MIIIFLRRSDSNYILKVQEGNKNNYIYIDILKDNLEIRNMYTEGDNCLYQ